jgi:uncharacterized protein (TIGR03437 family)
MKDIKKIIALFSILFLLSCSKDNDAPAIPVAPIVNLTITDISPTTGPKNTPVTITGTGFSTTIANNAVTINGKVCTIISTTATQMNITIPPSAGSGKIKIVVGDANDESNNFEFIVTTTVTTIAGSTQGYADGQGIDARFNTPDGITMDATGNLFVADRNNHRIRKISLGGVVTTIAGGATTGSVDGQGAVALFKGPARLKFDKLGNLFVVDRGNHRIRKITPTGLVSTFAGSSAGFVNGSGSTAQFFSPSDIAINELNELFITDLNNFVIRKISTNGFVSKFAGDSAGDFGFVDGEADLAKFNILIGIGIDLSGNIIVSDVGNDKIRKISPLGFVTTFAGTTRGFADGQINVAQFQSVSNIATDSDGNFFIADNTRIRKISTTGLVTTIAGSGANGFADGNALTSQFKNVEGLVMDPQGNLYVADSDNHKIRKITFD